MPAAGDDMSMIVGVAVFNFAYIIAVPSLKTESSPEAKFPQSMWTAVLVMLGVYCYVGGLGGSATHVTDGSGNVLNLFMVPGAPTVTRLAVFSYAFAIVLPIPVYVILLRRSLEQGNIVSPGLAGIAVSNAVPWALALLCYMQAWFSAIINWSSLLCLGFINYTVPLAIVIAIRREVIRNPKADDRPSVWDTVRTDGPACRGAVYFVLLTCVAVPAAIVLSLIAAL